MPARNVRTLYVAVDETGDFAEQKLNGMSKGRSGMAAVLSTWSPKRLRTHLEELASDLGLPPPPSLHARKIVVGQERRAIGLRVSDGEARRRVREATGRMKDAVAGLVGVYGRQRTARYFHEQQAWGEMLLTILSRVGERCSELLHEAQVVKLIVAARRSTKLCGYHNPPAYERALRETLRISLSEFGWPEATRIEIDDAEVDPYLIVADFFAFGLSPSATWVEQIRDLHQPAAWDVALNHLSRNDPAALVLAKLSRGEAVRPSVVTKLGPQARHETLRRLVTAAHGMVADRFDRGDLMLALRVVDYAWQPAADHAKPLTGELCTIAAEVLSHRGCSDSDPDARRWAERADRLSSIAWSTNLLAARATRLAHRCQTVQLDSFNVFDFERVYFEFGDQLEAYGQSVGEEALSEAPDELYGKLLGTVGQACGFLRPQAPSVGEDAWDYLCRSRPCFGPAQE